MPFMIQHGWGRGNEDNDRIRRALQSRLASGVVFGPDAQPPDRLETYIRGLRGDHPRSEILIDPQVYVATIQNPNYKRLIDYQDRYFEINLRRGSFRPRFIQSLVAKSFEWQLANGVSGIISPGVQIPWFTSPWAPIAISLAQESCDYRREHNVEVPLYATLAVSQEAFQDFDLMNEFLDEVTLLDADGFYLLIFGPGTQYRRTADSTTLANILHFIYSLGEMNQLRVIVGYADLTGYLYRAVGASDFASGWSHNLRRLTVDRWAGTGGGRQPLPRYTSMQLLNTVLVEPDLRRIYEEGQIRGVISNSEFDRVFLGTQPPQSVPWSKFAYHMQYLFVCSQLERRIRNIGVGERCREARSNIVRAARLYSRLTDNFHVVLASESGPGHLSIWQAALQEFCDRVGISL